MPRTVSITALVAAGLALAAAWLAHPAPAAASATQLTIVQDDSQIVYASPRQRAKRLDELKSLGADVVKMRVSWYFVAPGGRRRPRRFDATNPAAYSAARFGPYDDVVRQAVARGLRVYIDVGGDAPRWAGKPGRGGRTITNPSAREYGRFVQALGRRYSGSFLDLPRVSLWSVWNEPNLASWLAPQYRGSTPASPQIYRSLLYAASNGLRASGHPGDQLLIGELLPFARSAGSDRTKVRPLAFLRELACVDARYRPYRGRAAAVRGCSHFHRLPGTGVSYHPYTLAGGPDVPLPNRDDASIASLTRLTRTIDALGRAGRLETPRMPVWISEFGFRTNPPDPFQTPLARVPGFMGESEWLAYGNPRVVSYSQYPLYDDRSAHRGTFNGFASGLRYHNGRPKAGVYAAFKLPFYARWINGSSVEAFGGVRGGAAGTPVTVWARSARRHAHFAALGTVVLGAHGYFDRVFHVARARSRVYRFTSGRHASRTAPPA